MRVHHVSALAMALAVQAAPSADFDRAKYESDLKALAAKSIEEGKRCDAPYEKAKKAAGAPIETGTAKEGRTVFPSPQLTLGMLPLLADYPGFPPSGSQAMRMLANTPQMRGSDLFLLLHMGDCYTVGYYDLHKRLIDSADHYRLNAFERAKVGAISLAYLRKDLGAPLTLLGVMARLAIAVRLVETGILSLPLEARKTLELIHEVSEKVRGTLQDRPLDVAGVDSLVAYEALKPDRKQIFDDFFRLEQSEANRLREDLAAILNSTRRGGKPASR